MPPVQAGAWIVAGAAGLGSLTGFFLRTRLAPGAVAGLLVLAGAGLGWGGMLLQPDPNGGEFVGAVLLLAVMVPVHVRVVLGPFGPR